MVFLSFDIEEFDLPKEYGQAISSEEQIRISSEGLERILDILERRGIVATFYSTLYFMENIAPELRTRLLEGGHEIASHGVYHSEFGHEDYARSKEGLERITGQRVVGFRMARMQPVDYDALRSAGYRYDSSLHPTFLPGRYCHLDKSRLPYRLENGLYQLPASVTPLVRLPLFWLSLHNMPLWLYKRLASYTAQQDKYLNIYLHPWEFADLKSLPYKLPSYILRNSGVTLAWRLDSLIVHLQAKGFRFDLGREHWGE